MACGKHAESMDHRVSVLGKSLRQQSCLLTSLHQNPASRKGFLDKAKARARVLAGCHLVAVWLPKKPAKIYRRRLPIIDTTGFLYATTRGETNCCKPQRQKVNFSRFLIDKVGQRLNRLTSLRPVKFSEGWSEYAFCILFSTR
jgi:hypothetical protein